MSADPDSLRGLFLRHHRELRVFASRLADPDQAGDLVQEAFLRLLQHVEADRIAEPRAFLYKTLSRWPRSTIGA